MRVLILCAALAVVGCTIDPVITNPSGRRESGCREAARDYCRHVVKAHPDDMRECTSRHTFECESGRP